MLSARALRSASVTFTIQMRATSANSSPALTRQNMALDRFVLPGHGEIVKREQSNLNDLIILHFFFSIRNGCV